MITEAINNKSTEIKDDIALFSFHLSILFERGASNIDSKAATVIGIKKPLA